MHDACAISRKKKDAYAIDLVRLLLPHVYITHVFTVYVKQI
jgi:hypothetical protein